MNKKLLSFTNVVLKQFYDERSRELAHTVLKSVLNAHSANNERDPHKKLISPV